MRREEFGEAVLKCGLAPELSNFIPRVPRGIGKDLRRLEMNVEGVQDRYRRQTGNQPPARFHRGAILNRYGLRIQTCCDRGNGVTQVLVRNLMPQPTNLVSATGTALPATAASTASCRKCFST